MKAALLTMYGPSNIFGNHMRASRLASWCRSFSCWLCLFLALPASVMAFPFYFYQVSIPLSSRPTRYYSESEILSSWSSDPSVTSLIPPQSMGSLDAVYEWLYQNRPNELNLAIVCAITSSVRVVDFGEDFQQSTNQLVRVGIAPSVGEGPNQATIFPFWLSSRYGLGFIGVDGLDPFGSSPAFGGSMSWGGAYGFFTTNLTTTQPWDFQDWSEPGPLVWQRQDMPDYFRYSSSYFKGSLRVMSAYYLFPRSPIGGQSESLSGFPVTHSAAYGMLDEYWLSWWWQTVSGVYVWSDEDRVHVINVLRFHSSSTNQPGGL